MRSFAQGLGAVFAAYFAGLIFGHDHINQWQAIVGLVLMLAAGLMAGDIAAEADWGRQNH